LVPLASLPSTSDATTNHIQATPLISTSFSASSPVNAGIPSIPNYWLLDSGANEHICGNISYFTSFHRIKLVVLAFQIKPLYLSIMLVTLFLLLNFISQMCYIHLYVS